MAAKMICDGNYSSGPEIMSIMKIAGSAVRSITLNNFATLKMLFHKTEFATDILKDDTFCSRLSYDVTLTLIRKYELLVCVHLLFNTCRALCK